MSDDINVVSYCGWGIAIQEEDLFPIVKSYPCNHVEAKGNNFCSVCGVQTEDSGVRDPFHILRDSDDAGNIHYSRSFHDHDVAGSTHLDVLHPFHYDLIHSKKLKRYFLGDFNTIRTMYLGLSPDTKKEAKVTFSAEALRAFVKRRKFPAGEWGFWHFVIVSNE